LKKYHAKWQIFKQSCHPDGGRTTVETPYRDSPIFVELLCVILPPSG